MSGSFSGTTIDGREYHAQSMYPKPNSANAPRRFGPLDPGRFVKEPSFAMLDEQVGKLRGVERVQHPDGEDKFNTWVVTTGPAKPADQDGQDKPMSPKLFNDWSDLSRHWPPDDSSTDS